MNSKNLQDELLRRSGVNPKKCMRCGKCSATCPAYDEMEFHPHQFVYMVETGDIKPLLSSESLYRCLTCFACVDRCPRGVEPAKLVEAVRLSAIRAQGNNRITPDDIPAILDEDIPQQAIVSAFRKYTK
ncbi:MAG: 4Fe-4S dicluster domain-containing protein [Oscillospiraceae bacterium]|nr:4Fe-4S dicluster domain-containing protein [Oscillospiraceae bacterium]MBQ3225140.1 4Fe-4S dicluster domain-containing protein [Oscillospiraceae bacterium]MBQ4316151.1 4Fe-4S dicluster domain-containing protein [Oscillospiraceae bacterium]MBQ7054456.1 4Fe-4S dicluster domain-containing protein [Oscillospiraceae bacterium]